MDGRWLVRRLSLGRRGQAVGHVTVSHSLQLLAQVQAIQHLAGKLAGLEAQGGLDPQLATPADEIASHLLRFSSTVGHFVAQDVPDDHQELAGDGDDGLWLTNSDG